MFTDLTLLLLHRHHAAIQCVWVSLLIPRVGSDGTAMHFEGPPGGILQQLVAEDFYEAIFKQSPATPIALRMSQ